MTDTILIIDDEADIRDLLADIFEDEGYKILKAAHSEQALSLLEPNKVDLAVLDIWLDNSDMDGIQILKHIKQDVNYQALPILMISGHGNVEMAVNAMKVGAFDFIEKPFKIDHILLTVQRALEQKRLHEENSRLRNNEQANPSADQGYSHYKSPGMIALAKSMAEHSDSDARMMIMGGMGVGKTRMAKMVCQQSSRKDNALLVMHSNQFDKKRLSEFMAENEQGTVVLESVHLLSQPDQTSLLSILSQDNINTRVISTCDTKIAALVQDKQFSSALFDRLAVIQMDIPSLEDRVEDFEQLITECQRTIGQELGYEDKLISLSQSDMAQMKQQEWPGNIRQLKAVIEVMFYQAMSKTDQNSAEMSQTTPSMPSGSMHPAAANDDCEYNGAELINTYIELPLKQAREKFEFEYLSSVLELFDGNIAKMAGFVEMDRAALHRKLKSMNIMTDKKVRQS